jgi:hypothetical protein
LKKGIIILLELINLRTMTPLKEIQRLDEAKTRPDHTLSQRIKPRRQRRAELRKLQKPISSRKPAA